jgi:thymidylate kinase
LFYMELHYGRHRVAERVLRIGVPSPDLAILLELDPQQAARRKPGDQAPHVLTRMVSLYAAAGERHRLLPVDAGAPPSQVQREITAVVDSFLARLGMVAPVPSRASVAQ